jgi:gamma-glutamyltranspeptidase
MSPTIVLDGKTGALRAVLGASGGPRIITATARVLLNMLSAGLDPGAAVRAPRVHEQLLPDVTYAENYTGPSGQCIAVPPPVIAALTSRGDAVSGTASASGVVQLIAVDPDTGALHAVSDQRKEGTPCGF